MDIEQLKLILQAVNAAGAGAYQIAIIWFITQTVPYFLGFGVLFLLVIFARQVFLRMVTNWIDTTFVQRLSSMLGMSSWRVDDYERKKILKFVEGALKSKKGQIW